MIAHFILPFVLICVFHYSLSCAPTASDVFGTTGSTTIQITTPLATSTTPLPTTTTTNGDAAACSAAACDFSKGSTCSWKPSSVGSSGGNDVSGGQIKSFNTETKRLEYPNTGVPGPATPGGSYQGVLLHPGETAVMESGPLALSDTKSLLVKFWEVTDGIQLKACSNDLLTECQDLSNLGVKASDWGWRSNTYPIPKDAKKVLLVARNVGENHGAVGIDSVNLVNGDMAPDNGIVSDSQKLCK